ncbi:glycosyltransferase family 4 protein [Crocinitomicaceae bacterium]|nr:glycosyltransferase family 4 protein [Crocinitomicaceae bacterium]|tara:strand:- start:6235 stop:7281 length:1047 start_codon:yes stop_codon:yes gene_type:complete
MTETKSRRLLLIGSTQSDVHLRNYHGLIEGFFDEIIIVSGNKVDFCESKQLNFGLRNPLTIRKTIRELRSIINEFEPDVIHVHQANVFGYITSLANKGRVPQITTIWGSDVLLLPQKSVFHKYLVKKALKSSQHITADASFIKGKVNTLIGEHNFTTANFGIDLPNIEVDISKKEKVIYSNRLHDTLYNIDQVIEAFKLFREKYPGWKLVLAGVGPKTEELKALAQDLPKGSYEFIGFVDSETNFHHYQNSSIFVSIPSSDGTSISLLEAMAFGTIPVLSDLPANKEWITNGENGTIVQTEVDKALMQAAELSIDKVYDLNTKIIQEKATKEANRAKFIAIYTQLLKK